MNEAAVITKWSPTIYLGGWWGAIDEAALKERGVTAVCNLTHDVYADDEWYRQRGIPHYLKLDQADEWTIDRAKIETFVAWMRARDKAGDVVYIHCQMGISRTPSFLICWLLAWLSANGTKDIKQLWSRFEQKIGALRPIIAPHWKLKQSIIAYFEALS